MQILKNKNMILIRLLNIDFDKIFKNGILMNLVELVVFFKIDYLNCFCVQHKPKNAVGVGFEFSNPWQHCVLRWLHKKPTSDGKFISPAKFINLINIDYLINHKFG